MDRSEWLICTRQRIEPYARGAAIRSLTLVGDEHAPMWIVDYGYRTRTRRDARQGVVRVAAPRRAQMSDM